MTIKTKFRLNDTIWFMLNNKVERAVVTHVRILVNSDDTRITYTPFNLADVGEWRCFKTKEELINSL